MTQTKETEKMHKGLSALPLGGVGEIGMNLMAYECDEEMILVDVGLTFPDSRLPGVDLVLPDTEYIRKNVNRLKGIVITHAHEDHIGGLPYLWEDMPVDVYVTKFANCVLQDKLKQVGLHNEVPVHEVEAGDRIKIGKHFDIEYVELTHSIPEGHGVAIRTPHGTIMHTGDYKFDETPSLGEPSNKKRLKEIGDEGVLTMLGDSTNIFLEDDSGSEGEVQESLDSILAGRKNRVYLCTFASNVGRVKSAIEVAHRHNRKVALWGYSMKKMLKYAHKCGYIEDKLYNNIISPEEAMELPRNEVLILITGSQGEPRAALNRIIHGQILLNLQQDDTVLMSSKIIPGNERPIYDLINKMVRQGVEVIHEKTDFVHVSGHAGQDEIKEMYELIRPEIAIPVHGEAAHLKAQAEFAKKLGVPKQFFIENGTRVHMAPGKPKALVEESAAFGRVYVDGLNILDEDKFIIKERRQMSEQGVVTVAFSFDGETGKLNDDPVIHTRGIIDPDLQPELVEDAISNAQDAFYKAFSKNGADIAAIEEAVRIAVRRTFRVERERNPVTIVTGLMV